MKIHIEGATELMRACADLGRDAEDELRDQAFDISRTVTDRIKYAAAASDRQSARAGRTVRERRDRYPVITAGPHKLLFGSNFGATKHFGWYARGRYYHSPAGQFRPHTMAGTDDYWFYRTAEANAGYIESEWRQVAEKIIREWPR
jgi:hypothetical protein